ncbi:MAG: glycosyltransferase family 2 protein [Dehalococcoidia bacterium]|nr:glycosyltransferase family 2 protein [Dehalococcoidia bacterium]
MSGSPRVTAIIVNWRDPDGTLRVVDSLASLVPDGLRFVVVDNGSSDGSAAAIAAYIGDRGMEGCVTLLLSASNTGFCGGVNRAVEVALAAEPPATHLWLLNPDSFPTPGALHEMLRVAEESGYAVVAARVDGFTGEEHWPLAYFAPARFWKTRPQHGARWWPTRRHHGACALFEADLVRRLQQDGGLMDERLFMYWDEWDTALRVARAGGKFALAARAEVPHRVPGRNAIPGLREARAYYVGRNGVLIARTWLPWWQTAAMFPLHLARDIGWFCVLHRMPLRAYLRGVVDGLRGKSGIWERHPK